MKGGSLSPPDTENIAAKRIEVLPKNRDREQSGEEYSVLLNAFRRLYEFHENDSGYWNEIADIITLRASFLIDRVLTGLKMDLDQALDILKNFNDSTTETDRRKRNILVAAIDNLVDFATYEEMTMLQELSKENFNEPGLYENIFERYNLLYASEENQNVFHAAAIAAWWISVPDTNLLTFMTQADERVRAWHLSLEGLSFLKRDFPPELIPPIEWGCRCYLMTNGFGSVSGSLSNTGYKKFVNQVFCESLAKGGKIFSSAHPYFKTNLPEEAEAILNKIKDKFKVI